MPQDISQDVASIREWLAKENYLPQDFEDLMLRKFIHSCHGSLEKTKKCIERFCTTRSTMPEAYTNRDPVSSNIQTAFNITTVATYQGGDDEILIHSLDDPNLENFNFYDIIKSFCLQADYWLQVHEVFPEGHICIIDLKSITLKIVPKVNIMFFRDFLLYLLEGMPVRVKQVHVINCPSYYEKLYALIKPVLPQDIKNIINFHTNTEGVHKFIEPKYLPVELGGEATSMKQQHNEWVAIIQAKREIYNNDDLWKADLKKRPKNGVVENAMNGSFRTLSID